MNLPFEFFRIDLDAYDQPSRRTAERHVPADVRIPRRYTPWWR